MSLNVKEPALDFRLTVKLLLDDANLIAEKQYNIGAFVGANIALARAHTIITGIDSIGLKLEPEEVRQWAIKETDLLTKNDLLRARYLPISEDLVSLVLILAKELVDAVNNGASLGVLAMFEAALARAYWVSEGIDTLQTGKQKELMKWAFNFKVPERLTKMKRKEDLI